MKRLLLLLCILWAVPGYSMQNDGTDFVEDTAYVHDGTDFVEAQKWLYTVSAFEQIEAAATCSGNLGQTTYDGNNNIKAANKAYLTKITIDCTGTLDTISVYLADAENSNEEYILIIYDDDGGSGEPGTRLFASAADYDAGTSSGTYLEQSKTAAEAVTDGDVIWAGFVGEEMNIKYRQESGVGDSRFVELGSFAAPATWPNATDTHSTTARTAWVTYE